MGREQVALRGFLEFSSQKSALLISPTDLHLDRFRFRTFEE